MYPILALLSENFKHLPLRNSNELLNFLYKLSGLLLQHIGLPRYFRLSMLVGLSSYHLETANELHVTLDIVEQIEGRLLNRRYLLRV